MLSGNTVLKPYIINLQFVNIDLIRNSYRGINGIILSVSYEFNLQKNRYNESNAGVSERSRL